MKKYSKETVVGIFVVIRVLRQQVGLQFAFQLFTARLYLLQFVTGHVAQFRIRVLEHVLGRLFVFTCFLQGFEAVDDGVKLGVFD